MATVKIGSLRIENCMDYYTQSHLDAYCTFFWNILLWYCLNYEMKKRWRNKRNLPRLYSTTFITSYQPNLSQEASLLAGFVFEIW